MAVVVFALDWFIVLCEAPVGLEKVTRLRVHIAMSKEKKKEWLWLQSCVNYSSKYRLVCQSPSSGPADEGVLSFWPEWIWLVFENECPLRATPLKPGQILMSIFPTASFFTVVGRDILKLYNLFDNRDISPKAVFSLARCVQWSGQENVFWHFEGDSIRLEK